MSQKPIVMEQLKQILQLKSDGIGIREISRRTGISRYSVSKYLAMLLPASDADSPELSNQDLADKAYNNDQLEHDALRMEQLSQHFKSCQSELSKTGVTRQLLWQEYMGLYPAGYSYSRYCYHLKLHLKNSDVSMHLEYQSADIIMIDFAGKKQHYVDVPTGECIECQVFVAILPYSGLIFCIAVHRQQTAFNLPPLPKKDDTILFYVFSGEVATSNGMTVSSGESIVLKNESFTFTTKHAAELVVFITNENATYYDRNV